MALRRFRAAPASGQRYGLGEGPVWDAARERVLWVDINAGTVHAGTLGGERLREETVLRMPETVGAVLCSVAGDLLVAGARRLYRVDADGTVSEGPRIIPDEKASRLNDAGTDPAGRCLVGSLALDDREGEEVLVRVEADGRVTALDDDLTLSNGLAFTPDGAHLYSIDTTPRMVWVRDYDVERGTVGPRREALRVVEGSPDGMCLDSLGNLWIAIFGAGEVRCYSPAGEQLATVEVSAPNTTSVAFVGPHLDTLLITTASEQLTTAQLGSYPDSGRLFVANVEVSGLPVAPWAGAERRVDDQ
ncbi:MAG TPA: SMP-30/gluconolactonase/LRE family protein [Candidatus Dormibacteraeota bacterium]